METKIKTAAEMHVIANNYKSEVLVRSAIERIEERANNGHYSIIFGKHEFEDQCYAVVTELTKLGYEVEYSKTAAGWKIRW